MPPLRGWTCGRWSLLLPPQFHKSSSHTSSLEKEAHLATRSSPQGGTNLAQDVGPGNRFLLYGESLQGRYPIAELTSSLVNDLAADDCRHNFSAEAPTVEGSVLRLGARLRGIEGPLLPGIEDGDVGARTFCKRASASKPKDLGGIRGQQLDNPPQRQLEMLIQNRDGDGQRGLKAGDAEGSTLELDLLLVEGVGRVVGGNRVYGAVDDALYQSIAIRDRAQWRIHLVVGVEVADILIHQREMVRRNFGGDAKPRFLGAAHGFQGLAGREMRHVHVSPGRAGERDVPLDDVGLGGVRHAMQAQAERRSSQIHRAAGRHARVFGVLYHRNLQPGCCA